MMRPALTLGAALCAAFLGTLPAPPAAAQEAYEIAVDLGRVEALLARAHFREAGEQALLLRRQALALPPSGEVRRLLVRAELAAGTAAVALGQAGAARACFDRALRLDRNTTLSADAPPKLRRAFDAAKAMPR
jgi:tetratricopeptide (TPR) repeat protein